MKGTIRTSLILVCYCISLLLLTPLHSTAKSNSYASSSIKDLMQNPAPTCLIDGPSDICDDFGFNRHIYSLALSEDMGIIQRIDWEIIQTESVAIFNANFSETYTDETAPWEIDVLNVGIGSFTIQATVTYSPEGEGPSEMVTCAKDVTVHFNPVVTVTSSVDSEVCITDAPFVITVAPFPVSEAESYGYDSPAGLAGLGQAVTDNKNGTFTIDPSKLRDDEGYGFVYYYRSAAGCLGEDQFLFGVSAPAEIELEGPTSVCPDDDPVTFVGLRNGTPLSDGNRVAFTIEPPAAGFQNNGDGTAALDPKLTEAGIYTVTITYDNLGCITTQTLDIEVLPGPQLLCIGQANVNLQQDCQATLDWSDVLLGDLACADGADYDLIVEDSNVTNGNIVDGCGTYKYTVSGPNGFSCWGNVLAEDKQLPQLISCPEEVSGWSVDGHGVQDFVCQDIDKLLLDGIHTYKLDRNGDLIAGSFSSNQLRWLANYVTGFAAFSDNCGDITVYVEDEVNYGYDKNCDELVITRKFTARDACSNLLSAAACYQTILVRKPILQDVYCPLDAAFSCEEDLKLDAKGNPHPDETGYPWLYTAFDADFDPKHDDGPENDPKVFLNEAYCNLGASYTDGERIEVCDGSYKIVRTWEILDWCTQEVYECKQLIKVGDYQAPVVKCIEVDYDQDGHADIRTYSTGPYDCTASFEVPVPIVVDNCSGWTLLTEVISGTTDGPVVATIPFEQSRYISGIPVGCYFFKYTVADDCGNEDVFYCPFYVEDQIAPIATCNDDLHVSIGGEGLARVFAEDIDEGSTDNCGPVRLEVRRSVLAGADYECLALFDYDGDGEVIGDELTQSEPSGVPDTEKYYFTPWLDYIDFSCCDMNEAVRIELRVWDDRNGDGYPGNTIETERCHDNGVVHLSDNYNVCWLDVLIEDKVPAYCVPPPPAYIQCDSLPYNFDPNDSGQMAALFGMAKGADNCPGYTVLELPPNTEGLDDCRYGVLIRRFEVVDAKGVSALNACEQEVTIEEYHNYRIKFPKDVEAQCSTPPTNAVFVEELACDLLAVNSKDDFFSASGDECYKIFRTYSVINWCEYDGISDPVVVSRDKDCDGKPGEEDIWIVIESFGDGTPAYNTGSHCQEMISVGFWQYTQVIKVYDR